MNNTLEYQATRDLYLSNAQKLIAEKSFRKASELLWGAVTQQINNLALRHGHTIYTHEDYRNFIFNVTPHEIYELFLFVEELHRNFYHQQIDERDFPVYYQKVIEFLKKIEIIINQ